MSGLRAHWLVILVLALLSRGTAGVQTQAAPPPILLVTNSSAPNPFGTYLGEVLRAEGLNQFAVKNLAGLLASDLTNAQVVVLAETPLTPTQANLFSNYVAGGGRLVAMRPDSQLAPVLGLIPAGSSTNEGYFALNTGTTFADGFPTTTLPFHGPATNYTAISSATTLATLYSSATNATPFPAVVKSGKTVTWAYDLARSVVYTRQGNPANASDRDGAPPYRTEDLVFNAIDLDKLNIPYADVQMRMLGRVISDLMADLMPIPRLWYFPDANRTVMILTSDSHANPQSYYDRVISSVEARGGRVSIYMFGGGPSLSSTASWRANGHEFGMHPAAFQNGVTLSQAFQNNNDFFVSSGYGAPSATTRIHQLEWQGWVDAAKIEAAAGVHLDTSFYTWGPAVTYPDGHQAHGYINGSGLPMRFIDENGAVVPVYQQVTSVIDEQMIFSEQMTPPQALLVTRQLIDDSQAGGYSAITTQFHVDTFGYGEVQPWAEGTMDYARTLGIPMWTAERWLNYTTARAATTMSGFAWNAGARQLAFIVTVPANSESQSVALPAAYGGFALSGAQIDGGSASGTTQAITGRDTRFLNIPSGSHTVVATYGGSVPPTEHAPIANPDAANVSEGQTVVIPVLANDFDVDGDALTVVSTSADAGAVITINAGQTISYTPNPGTCGADTFSYTISDGRGGTDSADVTVTVTCAGGQVTHSTFADLAASCAVPAGTIVTRAGDGEVRLAGIQGDEYSQAPLDSSKWTAGTWSGGAYTPSPSGGVLSLSNSAGAYVRSASALPITSLESSVRFSGLPWEHVGWGSLDLGVGYAIFSTYNTTTSLFARTNDGGGEQQTNLGQIPIGFHTYRIERQVVSQTSNIVNYYIDGVLRAQHTTGALASMYVYQSHNGGTAQTLDIDRIWVYPTYTGSGTYQSCTMDNGNAVSQWTTANWSVSTPAGTSFQLRTRTSSDGTTWSGWSSPLTNGGAVTSPAGRYLQYLAELATTDSAQSAVLDSVTMHSNGSGGTLPSLSINDVAVTEGNAGTVSATFTVTLSAASNQPVTVQYATAPGTATTGDYVAASGTLTFNPGVTSRPINVTVNSDTTVEPDETFFVNLSSPGNAIIADAQGQGTIVNDDLSPTNHAPVANADSASVTAGQTVVIPVLANDTDADGDALTVVSTSADAGAVITINANQTISYTPKAGTCGADTFTYTISDGRGGTALANVTVTVTCVDGQVTHSTIADFVQSCAIPTGTIVTRVGDGEVRLAGTQGDEYSQASLDPSKWVAGTWSGGTYTPVPSGGVLSVANSAGAYVRSSAAFPLTTLESSVRFSALPWEHVGWGSLDFSGAYAMFSTYDTSNTLFARTNDGSGEQQTSLGAIPSGFHVYRIDRQVVSATANTVTYYVDGVQRAQHTTGTVPSMYVYQSHNGGSAQTLDIDRIWIYPSYAGSGTYQSCTMDIGNTTSTWTTANWSATTPSGASFQLRTRTSSDGTTWSGWSSPLTSGGTIASPAGRYLQYLVDLATTDSSQSAVLNSVTMGYGNGGGGSQPSLSINDVNVAEGDAGTVTATFTVTLSAASNQPVTVGYATAPGTASATPPADYASTSGTLTFDPGITSLPISVTVNGDTTVEPDETFFVNLSNPGNATIADGQGRGTIINDDAAAQPTLSINDVTVTEGNSGTSNATFTVSLSATSSQTVTVNYATAAGTASAGSDYQSRSGTLSFSPGITTRTFAVPIVGDTLVESTETFRVDLSAPTGATIARAQAIGTIVDNDTASITVTAPNTAATWLVGTTRAITWTNNLGSAATVRLELSRDGGSTWSVLAASVQNSSATGGTFNWTVSGALTSTARVRATWTANAAVTDSSNVNFTIANPTITVTSPNGGETWTVGTSVTVRWTSNLPNSTNVRIELSTNDGATYSTVKASTPDDGSLKVSVLSAWRSSQARIRVSWLTDTSVNDASNANFTIR